jgi:transposase
MWQFRRRRKDLTEEDEAQLQELFQAIPDLELPYCFREDIAEIFDTATSRQEAESQLAELREVITEEPDLLKFFETYDRWKDGILAYFDRHETSGVVEGLNNKARVITRRSYGLKCAESLWQRLMLDVNQVVNRVRYTVAEMHLLARSIQAKFRGYYT